MSRKTFISIIVLVIIIVGVIFAALFLNKNKENSNNPTDSEGTNFVSDFFNFGVKNKTNPGDNGDNGDVVDNQEPSSTEGEINTSKSILFKISSVPVVGFTVFNEERFKDIPNPKDTGEDLDEKVKPVAPPTESVGVVRYVNSINGNIYQSFVDNINERKFTDTTIPNVEEAFFGDNGNTVVMRYLKPDGKTIETFVGSLQKEVLGSDSASLNELKGSFLPENITDMSVLSDGSKMFYLFNVRDGVSGTTASVSGTNKVQVFDSKFTEWLSLWPTKNLITVTTKPSYLVNGYMYGINPDKKDFKKIVGGIKGLTTLTSPDGKKILYSNNNLNIKILDTNTGENKEIGVRTLSEKCTWDNSSEYVYCLAPKFIENFYQYPDSWYQGEVSFSDDIWKINSSTGEATFILDPLKIEGGGEFDGIKPALDKENKTLFFVNKKDLLLWGVRVK